jgi:uncharacterized protein
VKALCAVVAVAVVAAGCGGGDDGGAAGATAGAAALPELNARLWRAAQANRVDEARELIEQGANVNATDAARQTALHYAAGEGAADPAMIELLLDKGARVDALDAQGNTPLIRAARRGYPELVGPLVDAGADVDHVNQLGWTALLESVIFGDGSEPYAQTVRALVEAGADARMADVHGVPPRTHAELAGQTEVAAILRDAEAAD